MISVLSATGNFSLGVNNRGAVGRIVAQFVGASWVGSAVPKIRAPGAADADLKTFPYFNVATRALVAAGTAITGDGIFAFPVEGTEVVLVYTHTSGSASVFVNSVEGEGSESVTVDIAADETINVAPVKGAGTNSQVTSASATSATLIAANANRKSVVIANKHATATLYISTGTPALITHFPIPAGQSFVDDLTTAAWYGITDAAATDARVVEVA